MQLNESEDVKLRTSSGNDICSCCHVDHTGSGGIPVLQKAKEKQVNGRDFRTNDKSKGKYFQAK